MGLKHKLFGIVLLWPVLQGYAQEIKIGNYTFKDGAEYQGELFKGKPYGKGITHFKNGDSYEGEYVKGKRQGYGINSLTEKNTKANGFKTSNTGMAYIIS